MYLHWFGWGWIWEGTKCRSVDIQVNAAIDDAINAAVFVNLVGELGPYIHEATASAQMPVNEAINKAAASA